MMKASGVCMLRHRKIMKRVWALTLSVLVLLPQLGFAQGAVEENPSVGAMVADLVVVRPVMIGVTAVGAALYVVTLPFSLLGGNSGQAAKELVIKPAQTAFVRCLGCTKPGYRQTVDD